MDLNYEFDDLELAPRGKGKERWDSESEEEEEEYCDVGSGEGAGAASGRGRSEEEEEGAESANKSDCESEPGEMTCAICLENLLARPEDLALVKGCDHMYCVNCILQWALHKEHPWCPQCKAPFSYLLTYRTLDGTLQDFPAEESVCLLKRARWFEDHMRSTEKGKALLEESRLQDETAWQDWADEFDLASDDEIEAFYMSSAAGRARCVLGNRRFGEGGYISGGRRQAMPRRMRGKGTGKGAKVGEHAVVAGSPAAAPPAAAAASFRTPNAGGGRLRPGAPPPPAAAGPAAAGAGPSSASRSIAVPGGGPSGSGSGAVYGSSPTAARGIYGSSPSGSGRLYGSSPSATGGLYGSSPTPGSGRRAKRNARRAQQDYLEAAFAY